MTVRRTVLYRVKIISASVVPPHHCTLMGCRIASAYDLTDVYRSGTIFSGRSWLGSAPALIGSSHFVLHLHSGTTVQIFNLFCQVLVASASGGVNGTVRRHKKVFICCRQSGKWRPTTWYDLEPCLWTSRHLPVDSQFMFCCSEHLAGLQRI